jgi:hypothetical protein
MVIENITIPANRNMTVMSLVIITSRIALQEFTDETRALAVQSHTIKERPTCWNVYAQVNGSSIYLLHTIRDQHVTRSEEENP